MQSGGDGAAAAMALAAVTSDIFGATVAQQDPCASEAVSAADQNEVRLLLVKFLISGEPGWLTLHQLKPNIHCIIVSLILLCKVRVTSTVMEFDA